MIRVSGSCWYYTDCRRCCSHPRRTSSLCTHFRWGACCHLKLSSYSEVFSLEKGVNGIFPNQFGISGLPEAWITPDELHGAILCVFYLGECCNAVLQRSSRNVAGLRNRGVGDDDWTFIIGWTVPSTWFDWFKNKNYALWFQIPKDTEYKFPNKEPERYRSKDKVMQWE